MAFSLTAVGHTNLALLYHQVFWWIFRKLTIDSYKIRKNSISGNFKKENKKNKCTLCKSQVKEVTQTQIAEYI